jgi:hypothetical protein
VIPADRSLPVFVCLDVGGDGDHSPAHSAARSRLRIIDWPPPHAKHRMDRRHSAGESIAKRNAISCACLVLSSCRMVCTARRSLWSVALRSPLFRTPPTLCVALPVGLAVGSFKIRCH